MTKGLIHSLESFGSVDGPGIRYVVFMKGCRMRCRFCHNPDTWEPTEGKGDQWLSADELMARALRFQSYWGKRGGITVSGGEPLLQIDFLLELFEQAKAGGINTALDTAAQPFTREEPFFGKFERLMELTDLVLLDIKHIDPERHRWLTGHDNGRILDCARYLSDIGKPVWLRHVLVPGVNDQEEYLERLAAFARTLNNIERIEVLPYHTLGTFKWRELGLDYPLEATPTPIKEQVARAEEILNS